MYMDRCILSVFLLEILVAYRVRRVKCIVHTHFDNIYRVVMPEFNILLFCIYMTCFNFYYFIIGIGETPVRASDDP